MKTALYRLTQNNWEKNPGDESFNESTAQLILCFASKSILLNPAVYESLKVRFPGADIALSSTSGEIYQDSVLENSAIAVAMQFSHTDIKACKVNVKDFDTTYKAAISLARLLPETDLRYILVLSDGSRVNGSELVKGISSQVDKNVLITGGLAGDGSDFRSTLVGLNESPEEGTILAIGFYGDHIHVTHGSQGGWDIFGLEKRVTNSSGNILVELEDQNALELYKKYLGPQAEHLPGSALLFPLSVIIPGTDKPVVRTILSINEEDKSMTFAGDIPVGSKVRFMKANFDKLTHAAAEAAGFTATGNETPEFSLLISCVGRKLVLGSKTGEEVKAVCSAFENKTRVAGFYSYGEISPFNEGGNCQLHNQTMTITSFYEK